MTEKWCAVYLSGTGNTEYCIKKFTCLLNDAMPIAAIEDKNAIALIKDFERIVLGYPIQFSNMPVMVKDFISANSAVWQGKKVFCIATMGLFSGDGTGCSARLLKKYGATILGGLHLKMPDNICDSKLLKKRREENIKIIEEAEDKIEQAASKIKHGKFPHEGLSVFSHIAGLFGQRLWFCGKTKNYSDKLKINSTLCIGCGTCAKLCPMGNLKIQDNKAAAKQKCTMCYRCISKCPKKAITLLGKQVVEQHRMENYMQ